MWACVTVQNPAEAKEESHYGVLGQKYTKGSVALQCVWDRTSEKISIWSWYWVENKCGKLHFHLVYLHLPEMKMIFSRNLCCTIQSSLLVDVWKHKGIQKNVEDCATPCQNPSPHLLLPCMHPGGWFLLQSRERHHIANKLLADIRCFLLMARLKNGARVGQG